MTSLPDLLTAIARGPEATRPRLTHYDADGRIELSGKVLLNWVAKAANLLTTEYDSRPRTSVGLDLPVGHWRAAYWALAAWWTGAGVHCVTGHQVAHEHDGRDSQEGGPGGDTPTLDVLVTSHPDRAGDAVPDIIAVTPAALARRSPTSLPPGVVDEAAVLASYGDVFEAMEAPEPGDTALTGGPGHALRFADLVTRAPDESGSGSPRLLLAAPASQRAFLVGAVAAWAADGSVVVTPETDPQALERIATQEGTTQRG